MANCSTIPLVLQVAQILILLITPLVVVFDVLRPKSSTIEPVSIHVHSQPSSMQAHMHVSRVHMAATTALVVQSIHAYSVQRDFSLKAGIAVLAAPRICMLIQTQEFVINASLPV